MTIADDMKRAARWNAAWQPAGVFKTALDDAGQPMIDAEGTFVYDQCEATFARLVFDNEEQVFIQENPWQGRAHICIITSNQPDQNCLIEFGGNTYLVQEVIKTDATGSTVNYRASAIVPEMIPSIRNRL